MVHVLLWAYAGSRQCCSDPRLAGPDREGRSNELSLWLKFRTLSGDASCRLLRYIWAAPQGVERLVLFGMVRRIKGMTMPNPPAPPETRPAYRRQEKDC